MRLPFHVVVELHAGRAIAVVDAEGGGRLTRLLDDGVELLAADGCFVMAPWAGRTGYGRFTFEGVEHRLPVPAKHAPHAIHGTVRSRPWTVLDATGSAVHLSIDLGPDWPWPGRCEHRIGLADDRISLELSVHSDGPAFPAVIGWHPWFTKPTGWDIEADALLERGADHLPTGARLLEADLTDRPLDDCFEGPHWPVLLHRPELTLSIDATGCRYAVVYDEQAHATCVEPQTGPPNGLATGEHEIVTPGHPLVATTTWAWRRPSIRGGRGGPRS
jgi:aldose 1-epimerase